MRSRERRGVSLNTVSLALRGSQRLKTETRERIQHLAQDMGYTPNPLIAAGMAQLRSQRPVPPHGTAIAYLHLSQDKDLLRWAGVRAIIAGCEQRCVELGYRLERIRVSPDPSRIQALARRMQNLGIPGAVFAASVSSRQEDWLLVITEGIPIVTCGRKLSHLRLHGANSDHFNGARLALETAFSLGYSRPGLIIPSGFDELLGWPIRGGFFSGLGRFVEITENFIPPLTEYPPRPGPPGLLRGMVAALESRCHPDQ